MVLPEQDKIKIHELAKYNLPYITIMLLLWWDKTVSLELGKLMGPLSILQMIYMNEYGAVME